MRYSIFIIFILFFTISCSNKKETSTKKNIDSVCLFLNFNSAASKINTFKNLFDFKKSTFYKTPLGDGLNQAFYIEFEDTNYISKLNISFLKRRGYIYPKNIIVIINNKYYQDLLTNVDIEIYKKIKSIRFIPYRANKLKCIAAYVDTIRHEVSISSNKYHFAINEIIFYDSVHKTLPVKIINKPNDTILLTQEIVPTYHYKNKVFGELENKYLELNSNNDKKLALNINNNGTLSLIQFDTLSQFRLTGKWEQKRKSWKEASFHVSGVLEIFDVDVKYDWNIIKQQKIELNYYLKNNKIIFKKLNLDYFIDFPNDALFDLMKLQNDFAFDIRYATNNNFTKTILYKKPNCYTRYRVALDLINANKEFHKLGFKILIFDAYRPLSVQKKMWEILPNKNYVANPERGSIHNRGGAIDLSLVTLNNKPVDMGTDFDFFGVEAFHAYLGFPKRVLDNRILLKETLKKHGFMAIKTEWWHYSHWTCLNYPILDITFE